jgi:CRISPR-associated protein Cmr3
LAALAAICKARRARLVLTTPALLPDGWQLPGVDGDHRLELPGLSAHVVCAAVPRADVISGWDLALRQPKPAERFAPAGSVYWLADLDSTPDALGKLAAQGLWPDAADNPQRRAEGFNRFSIAVW